MLGGQGWVGRILKMRVLNLCHNESITCLNYFSKIEISYFFCTEPLVSTCIVKGSMKSLITVTFSN